MWKKLFLFIQMTNLFSILGKYKNVFFCYINYKYSFGNRYYSIVLDS